jgi:hypothetical protein
MSRPRREVTSESAPKVKVGPGRPHQNLDVQAEKSKQTHSVNSGSIAYAPPSTAQIHRAALLHFPTTPPSKSASVCCVCFRGANGHRSKGRDPLLPPSISKKELVERRKRFERQKRSTPYSTTTRKGRQKGRTFKNTRPPLPLSLQSPPDLPLSAQ